MTLIEQIERLKNRARCSISSRSCGSDWPQRSLRQHPAFGSWCGRGVDALQLSGHTLWRLYQARWPIEQVPLVAKQTLGGARQFVYAPESCQRLPERT